MSKHSPIASPGLFNPVLAGAAARDALGKLAPRRLSRNPVIFCTAVVAALATLFAVVNLGEGTDRSLLVQIAFWLWATVVFANFAEALAEGRGKARADALRATQGETMAKRVAAARAETEFVSSRKLQKGAVLG